jgi:hypothetical protein
MLTVNKLTKDNSYIAEEINLKNDIMKNLLKLFAVLFAAAFLFSACEGPMGPAGADGANGANGADGQDANETCKLCHNPTVVDQKTVEFDFSKHKYGEAAFEEGGNTTCAPCHESEGFKYVCKNNIPATFTLNTTTGKYSNNYVATTSIAYGELSCFTCHSSLHKTYAGTEFLPLTNTAEVQMTMWKAEKTINLTQDAGIGNLCVKCHQPRPMTTSTTLSNGDVIDYAGLVSDPSATYYDSSVGNAAPNKHLPSYRMHVHYGTVGAVFAGTGGIEFTGTQTYSNSPHTAGASCEDCHMAPITGVAGGHTFKVRSGEGALTSNTTWNFNGCNVSGCHSANPITSTSTLWTATRTEIKTLLNNLATSINAVGGGTDILHSEPDGEANLWAGITTGNYDGYLDIYDPSSNPGAAWKNPGSTSSWTQPQRDANNALPTFPSLKNVQMGAMINFQFCLREYSLGIHNYKYSKALLQNSLDALTAAGS